MHILPTRGRPELLQRYFTEGKPQESGVVIIDSDQSEMYDGIDVSTTSGEPWHVIYVPPMMGFVWKVNMAFKCFPDEPWYAFGGDDLIGRTPGWDTKLAAVAAQGYVAWGDDMINGACTHPYIHGDFCRDLGWVAHPAFKHLYVDAIWEAIAHRLGVSRYMPEIKTEAHHFCNGKLPFDKTAGERMEGGDGSTWQQLIREGEIDQLVAKLAPRCESLSR